MSTVKELNFVQNDIFYIHGIFDETISYNLIPQLKDKITKLINAIQSIKNDKTLNEIEKNKRLQEQKIIFDINSVGGQGSILFTLLNLVMFAKSKGIIIETHIHEVASAASILAICGTKGYRFGGIYSSHYIHNARGSDFVTSSTEAKRSYENWQIILNRVKQIYADNTTLDKDTIETNIEQEYWVIYGNELKTYGLIDKFFDEIEEKPSEQISYFPDGDIAAKSMN